MDVFTHAVCECVIGYFYTCEECEGILTSKEGRDSAARKSPLCCEILWNDRYLQECVNVCVCAFSSAADMFFAAAFFQCWDQNSDSSHTATNGTSPSASYPPLLFFSPMSHLIQQAVNYIAFAEVLMSLQTRKVET